MIRCTRGEVVRNLIKCQFNNTRYDDDHNITWGECEAAPAKKTQQSDSRGGGGGAGGRGCIAFEDDSIIDTLQ